MYKITHMKIHFGCGVVSVLVNDALCSLEVFFFGTGLPPLDEVTFLVELTSLIVEAVSYFVSHDESYGTVVHVFWSVIAEERALQNSSREFCKI